MSSIQDYKQQIVDLLEVEKIVPEQKMNELRMYDFFLQFLFYSHQRRIIICFWINRYTRLFNDEELNKVKAFLADGTKTIDDYQEKINYYYNLARQISIELEKTIFAGLFEINLGDFIATLVGSVESFKASLIERLVTNYQTKAKSWVSSL